MKKSRALRNWAIVAIVALVLCLAAFICGTIFSASIANRGFVWVPAFGGYLTSLINVLSIELWSFSGEYLLYSIIFVALAAIVVCVFATLLIVGIVKKKRAVVGASFFELVFGLFLVYFFMMFFTGNFNAGTFDKAILNDLIATLSFSVFNMGTVLVLALLVVLLTFVVCYFGIFGAALVRAFKKEEVAELEEEPEEEPVQEEVAEEEAIAEPVEEEPAAEEKPRKKGILLIRGYDKYGPRGVLVGRDFDYPREPLPQKPLTADEVREILRDELERAENERIVAEYKAQKQVEAIAAALAKQNETKEEPKPAEETKAAAEEKEEEKVYPTPIVFASPVCVKEENKPAKKAEVKKEEGLTEDQVKSIIAEEIRNALKDFALTVQKEVRVIEEVRVPAEEPAVEAEPVEEPAPEVEVHEEPAPAPVEEPAPVEVAPAANEEVVVEEVVEPAVVEEQPKEKIVRVPFTVRIQEADEDVKNAFNQLKSLLKSYNLNDRVSMGGDSFRLHRVTYCKITMAGKGLKLYLALNPEDYANTTLPIKDASSKAAYRETPLVFKVKSGLSVRRAEDLIRECMDKHGIEQADKVQPFDWVNELSLEAIEEGDEGDDE